MMMFRHKTSVENTDVIDDSLLHTLPHTPNVSAVTEEEIFTSNERCPLALLAVVCPSVRVSYNVAPGPPSPPLSTPFILQPSSKPAPRQAGPRCSPSRRDGGATSDRARGYPSLPPLTSSPPVYPPVQRPPSPTHISPRSAFETVLSPALKAAVVTASDAIRRLNEPQHSR